MNMGLPLTFLLDYELTLEATRAIGNALIGAPWQSASYSDAIIG
jgi:hypothetical protein